MRGEDRPPRGLAYRRADCLSDSDEYAGGTLSAVEFARCVLARNRQHLKDLATFQDAISPH